MADKKKEEVDPIIEAAKQAEVIEVPGEKQMGMKLTKPPKPTPFMGAKPGEAKTAPPGSQAHKFAEMTIEEILAAEKAKIRAAELKKQELIDKKQSGAKK